MTHVVIIGNGISGITAARHIRKQSDFRITVISDETPYFYSRTALMYVFMGHMSFENTKPYEDRFWKKNRIELVFDRVEKISPQERTLHLASGTNIAYDKLILATGSQSQFHGWPGQHLAGVQGLYSYQDLLKMEAHTAGITDAVIVGGGLLGVEMAEMLRSRNIAVTMLVREPAYWSNVLPLQDARFIGRHIESHGVVLKTGEELVEIIPGDNGVVKGVRSTKSPFIPCGFVGLATGVRPNIDWLKNCGIETDRGILVNEYLETNIPGIYAAGDCTQRHHPLEGRKDVEQVWYTARIMGETVARTVCGERTPYAPGPWFNSAKFFDIEFQTYGSVQPELRDGEAELYWEHPGGRKALHLIWKKDSGELNGINAFGIRLRHDTFDHWLRTRRTIYFVVDHLHEANFDPEFSERYEHEIRQLFHSSFKELAGTA